MARRFDSPEPPENTPLTTLGIDVARGGDDQTIILKNYADWIDDLVKEPGQMTPDGQIVADMVHAEHEGNAKIYIDSVGIGASPFDILDKILGLPVIGINAGEGSNLRDKSNQFGFKNKRAEMWWRLREILEPGSGRELVLPNDRELLADLCAPRYSHTTSGIQIESKDEVRKRLGRSTDCGDALVMALYEEPVHPPPVSASSSISQDALMRKMGLI